MSIKDDVDILKWICIVEEEINVKSDRALVITIASILDTQLEKLLKEFMIQDNKIDENIFNQNAPLSNFSSKISMCYYLGLISKYEYNTLNIIRKIRNKLAHEIEIKRMNENQSIVDLSKKLTIPDKIYIPNILVFSENENIKNQDTELLEDTDIQQKIIRVFKNLTMYLEYRIIEIYEVKRREYENISVLELMEQSKDKIIKQNKQIYNYCMEEKELLLSKIDILKSSKDKKDEIEKLKKQILKIDETIKEYNDGNIFYGTSLEKYVNSQFFMKTLNDIIEALKSKEKENK